MVIDPENPVVKLCASGIEAEMKGDYVDAGNAGEALRYYQLGLDKAAVLPGDRLGDITREGLMNGVARVTVG